MFQRTHQATSVRRPRPTMRGWGLLGAGVVVLAASAFFARSDLLFGGLVLVTCPLAAMLSVTIDRPRLSATRTFSPEVVAIDETTTVTTTARNQAALPTPAAVWRERAPLGLAVQDAAPFPRLAGHSPTTDNGRDTVTLRQRVTASRRGAHDIGPLIVTRTDPFGLAYGEFSIGQPKQLLVTPRVTALPRGELDIAKSEGTEHELLRHSIPSADELIAREYRPGDPLRRVHWRATARHDKLMVRQEEQRSNPEAWMLFDTQRDTRRDPHQQFGHEQDPAFEAVVELVASIAVHLLDQGFVVSVVETGPRQLAGRTGAGRSGTLGTSTPTFDLGGADQLLLAELAGVEQSTQPRDDYIGELSAGLRRSGRAVPVFAVLLDGSLDELGALGSLRPMCEPAVAFIGETADPMVAETLGRAGWFCAPFDRATGTLVTWQRALARHRAVSHSG
ncbi:MAG: hypothetical protein QOD05_180 [Microbacteriaceae bacterium]|nr:hypothetical protein [Microbacteriaceae bacterium]